MPSHKERVPFLAGAAVLCHLALATPEATSQPVPRPSVWQRTDYFGDPLPTGAVARVGTLRLYHGSQFAVLAFSPDGKSLAACSHNDIRLWETATGREVRQLLGPGRQTTCAAFSPNGSLFAAGGWGDVRVWRLDADSAKEVCRLPTPNGAAFAVAFAPDGKLLAVAAKDRLIHLWEVDGWREVGQLAGHTADYAPFVAFLPDGRTLISGCDDGSIRIWDVRTRAQVRVFADNLKGFNPMALSPNGKRLAIGESRRTFRLWDLDTGKELSRFEGPEDSCWCVAFAPDSGTVAGGGLDGKVHLWETTTGKKLHTWTSAQGSVQCLAFALNGKIVAVGGGGMIRFREVATGKDVVPLGGLPDLVTTVAFTEGGKLLMTACAGGDTGSWDVTTGKERVPRRHCPDGFSRLSRIVTPVALDRDGKRAASLASDRSVWVWDTATGTTLSRFGDKKASGSIAFAPDDCVVAAAHNDKTIQLWDFKTGRQCGKFGPADANARGPVFSPDGQVLAAVYVNRSVRLWNRATGKELRCLRWQGMNAATCLTFSPDGRLLASGFWNVGEVAREATADHTLIRIWDVATGDERRQFQGTWYMVHSIAFSPDSKMLAVGGHDRSVRVLEVASGQERVRFDGHLAEVSALAFAPNGQLLASGSYDRTALVWDIMGRALSGPPRVAESQTGDLDRLWADLASADAPRAFRAIQSLSTSRLAVPLLAKRLQPMEASDAQRVARLLAGLENEDFAAREQATRDLMQMGELAQTALGKALVGNPSLEARRRIERLLEKLKGTVSSPERLRQLRSVEVLEHIGTLEAKQVLARCAQGTPESWLTQEAKASLKRLAR